MFCDECFKQFYESLILEQNKHNQLTCPEYGCPNKPTEEEVKMIISDTGFKKY